MDLNVLCTLYVYFYLCDCLGYTNFSDTLISIAINWKPLVSKISFGSFTVFLSETLFSRQKLQPVA